MIRPTGNNPLKFSLDDDALASLLGVGRRGGMPAEEAIAEAFNDLRMHELATISAMQAAARVLLEQFVPEAIERKSASSSLLLPAQKKAKAWDSFVAQHKTVTQALSDDFDSVFGKAFARAYEQAIEKLANDRTGESRPRGAPSRPLAAPSSLPQKTPASPAEQRPGISSLVDNIDVSAFGPALVTHGCEALVEIYLYRTDQGSS